MNANDRVKVILTEAGLDAYRDYYKLIIREAVAAGGKSDSLYRIFDKEVNRKDKELKTQLWDLMNMFGPKMFAGAIMVFEQNEIELLDN